MNWMNLFFKDKRGAHYSFSLVRFCEGLLELFVYFVVKYVLSFVTQA